ncbi:MAG TPA: glycosyltransferase [Gaiella sp.]|nr:glycosyltransferase [Gaiella sp.]
MSDTVRILLVSQMYPAPRTPDLGTFVADLEAGLAARGHEIARAVVDERGGRSRHFALAYHVLRETRRFRPHVVYAHFLVPAGLLAVLAGRAPVVLTAHGQDVANAERSRAVREATRLAVRRAAGVVAVSAWLRARLEAVVPEAAGRVEVIDCGVDVVRFAPGPADVARAAVGWDPDGTAFLCVGALSERKNVLRLARAFERRGEGSLAFVGDGPLREALEGRPRIRVVGSVAHGEIPGWLNASDVVCQPSLVEPFGLATLEAMACARSVVATRIGGPREFVPSGAGVLVDPHDDDALVEALSAAATLPRPNAAARAAAELHDVAVQVARIEALLERAASAAAAAAASS